jgi:hypothetical protein
MTPGEFIAKWSDAKLRERAAAQSHFIDLCRMLGEKAPTDADPKGEWYAFEKGALKTAAATAGPMCGGGAALPGNTRVRART